MSIERFGNLLPPEYAERLKVFIAGVGAIGSPCLQNLAKLGISNVTMYDPDKVEDVNVGVQAFDYTQLEEYKVDAMTELFLVHSPHTQVRVAGLHNRDANDPDQEHNGQRIAITSMIKRVENNEPLLSCDPNVVIAAVDNVETRVLLFNALEKWKAQGPDIRPRLYIDGRMGAHTMEVWAVLWGAHKSATIKKASKNYLKSLKGDFQAAPCGEVALPPTASMCGAMMATLIRAFAMGEPLCRWVSIDTKNLTIMTDGMITDYL